MLDKKTFFKNYQIDEKAFNDAGLNWQELQAIYKDYKKQMGELEPILNMVADVLRKHEKVHSIKQRLKDPEHLIEKIIRKCIKDPARVITKENYKNEITDLLGIRIIHLFKEDWEDIHKLITDIWELKEEPVANIRKGDDETTFTKYHCQIRQHPYGYRSVHYLIKVKPYKTELTVELQVRTIFEEGWSEIDHQIRYPYDIDNTIIANYLVMFNRIAGSADEMGSYIRFLHQELSKMKKNHEAQLEQKNKVIKEMEEVIENSKMEAKEKEAIRNRISTLAGVLARAANQVDPLIMKEFNHSLMNTLHTMPLGEKEKEAFNFFLNSNLPQELEMTDIGDNYRALIENTKIEDAIMTDIKCQDGEEI